MPDYRLLLTITFSDGTTKKLPCSYHEVTERSATNHAIAAAFAEAENGETHVTAINVSTADPIA